MIHYFELIRIPHFEGKLDFYYILSFIVIPIVSSMLILSTKKKRSWLIPFISFGFFLIVTAVFFPDYILDNLGLGDPDDDFAFVSGWWLLLCVPLQIFNSLIAAVIAFAISKRKKHRDDEAEKSNIDA